MMILDIILQADWESVAKIWGPLGVGCFLLILFVWRGLLPYIKKQQEDNKQILTSTIEDARKERDFVRQLREVEVDKFLNSLKLRDEKMERGFQEVVHALRDLENRK